MKKENNISQKQYLKTISIALSLILCLNFSITNEEKEVKSEKEVETEVIFNTSKFEIDKIKIYTSTLISHYGILLSNFHLSKENYVPYINVKLYIYYCQLALKERITTN